MYMQRHVRVYHAGQHRFFDDLVNYCLSHALFGAAVLSHRDGLGFDPRDWLQLEGSTSLAGAHLIFRPGELLDALICDDRPTMLQFREEQVDDWAGPPNRQPRLLLAQAAYAAFVHYYESALDQMKTAHGNDPAAWPGVLRFGWAIRNAFAHDGQILFKNPNAAPVTWRGLTYGPRHNGQRVLYVDLMPADLVILMDEMDAAF
jgi:hypothetical protein